MPSNLFDRFRYKLESLHGHVHFASDWSEAGRLIEDVIAQGSANCAAMADLPQPLASLIEASCALRGVSLLKPPYAASKLPNALDAAQIGITMAEFGIADTGTLVEVTRDDSTRLISGLPRTHIGLLFENDLIGELAESAGRLRTLFAQEGASVVSFISGPSRTGDIELKLTLGVHGPEETHAIVLDSAAPRPGDAHAS